MPRRARERSENGIYHIILRGINKQNLFEDDEDRQRFIKTLSFYKGISNYTLYGYCLMNNHIHLLMRENDETISQAIKRISSSYVYWYNQKYKRCGHLFQERFKSEVVETDEYFLTVLRYIHQNPIKAGLTREIRDYQWNSYFEYIEKPTLADIDFGMNIFSSNRMEALSLFETYMNEQTTEECLDDQERISLSDKEIIDCLQRLGIEYISELQRYEKAQRNEVLREVKAMPGVRIRQLARITGISKSVIDRI